MFVDGRYTLQVKTQCPSPLFEHEHLIERPPQRFLSEQLAGGDVVGVDARCLSLQSFETIQDCLAGKGIGFQATGQNLVDEIWLDRPKAPVAPILLLDQAITGMSSMDKRSAVADVLIQQDADAALITQLDSIAWLLNIRGDDVPHLPVLLAHGLITKEGHFTLFTDVAKMADGFSDHVCDHVSVAPIEAYDDHLAGLSKGVSRLLVDPQSCHAHSPLICMEHGIELVRQSDPAEMPKACKNATEIAGIRKAHHRDGIALCRFLAWLDVEVSAGHTHDEGSVSDRLEAFRRELPELKDCPSERSQQRAPMLQWPITHTNGTPASLTMDSCTCGQRRPVPRWHDRCDSTIAIGNPTPSTKRCSPGLKGHIALARAQFPHGVGGNQLDILARQFLWEIGKDYDHGTGHGVGCYLSVHEGPQRIGKTPGPTPALRPGMVVSNEPGYYEPNAYGIRCENLVVVVENDHGMLSFESLTLAPFDRRLIERSLLTDSERQWLDDYHALVFQSLSEHLDDSDRDWLTSMTAPLAA